LILSEIQNTKRQYVWFLGDIKQTNKAFRWWHMQLQCLNECNTQKQSHSNQLKLNMYMK